MLHWAVVWASLDGGWFALCPLDEALTRAVVDISSRPHAEVSLQLTREKIGRTRALTVANGHCLLASNEG